jgi:ribosome-associated toxin RatA of RatAB toxin-antitoxin module
MNDLYKTSLLYGMRDIIHQYMFQLFRNITRLHVNDVERYKRFASNIHRARLISRGGFNENEIHIIHWMANLRSGSSTSFNTQNMIHGFVDSLDNVRFMSSLINVADNAI